MMAVGMYVQGAGLIAMILATFILNLRHLIMSTCVVNRMEKDRVPVMLLAAFGVTDESFAIFTTGKKENCTSMYFLGLITVTYTSWIAGSAIGALASGLLPPVLSASLGILVIVTALVNMALSKVMSSSWALIVSTLICAAAGVFFVDPGEGGAADE